MQRCVFLVAALIAAFSAQLFQPPAVWPASHQLEFLGIPWNQGGKVKLTVVNTDGRKANGANVPFNPNPLILHLATANEEKYVIINRDLADAVVEHNGRVVFGSDIKDQIDRALAEQAEANGASVGQQVAQPE